MSWNDTVFLLPLWFGWVLIGMVRETKASRGFRRDIRFLLPVLLVAVLTSAVKLWLDPPRLAGEWVLLAIVFAELSVASMVAGGLLNFIMRRLGRRRSMQRGFKRRGR